MGGFIKQIKSAFRRRKNKSAPSTKWKSQKLLSLHDQFRSSSSLNSESSAECNSFPTLETTHKPSSSAPGENDTDLFSALDVLRQSRKMSKETMFLEGEFKSHHVFVRDILIAQETKDTSAMLSTLRAIQHPNIAKIVHIAVKDDRLIVLSQRAMETVEAKIKKAKVYASRKPSPKGQRLIRGIKNLDLKPSSVLVFPDNVYKLSESCLLPVLHNGKNTNFKNKFESSTPKANGNARTYKFPRRTSSTNSLFTRQPISGSPEYQSIEALGGIEELTEKTDVFSFGMLLWQLVHLRPAYPADWAPLMILKSLQDGHRPHIDTTILGMESLLRTIIELCWATEPEKRPSFDEIFRMLTIAKKVNIVADNSLGATRQNSRHRHSTGRVDFDAHAAMSQSFNNIHDFETPDLVDSIMGPKYRTFTSRDLIMHSPNYYHHENTHIDLDVGDRVCVWDLEQTEFVDCTVTKILPGSLPRTIAVKPNKGDKQLYVHETHLCPWVKKKRTHATNEPLSATAA
eukprot:CAMPEP_0203804536 /NCGR_PEP_ID=MMETSP0100_2-20121128/13640_1 /ASSEMBLY_ACC=CAM_ASM_000210 /TAXON_ID=96639 /ORGANISM=" , Strain NY0313808BC1" /LENGTH=513 /DNA_ID=CAMNT_0050712767 /DNA_START=147 /DNA_END=1689 /DNA_ORIENTATION=+